MSFPAGITAQMTPEEALTFTVAFLDSEPDDDSLCNAALTIGEPLVDRHWKVLESQLIELLRERTEFRKLISCCDFDARVPPEFREILYGFVTADENLGGAP